MEKVIALDLQRFNTAIPTGGPENGGTPGGTATPDLGGGQGQGTPNYQPQGGGQPNFGQGGEQRPDGHVIRNVLSNARQQWESEISDLRAAEQILRQNGMDARTWVQNYQQAQEEAQRQQQYGGIDPRLVNYLEQMQGQLGMMGQYIEAQQRQSVMTQIQGLETENANAAKKYGIEYTPQVRDQVRRHAVQRQIPVDAAFRELYFDHILSTNGQQAQGQAILGLQGRGQQGQPISSAVPGSGARGPIDWRTVSSKDFHAARDRMRNGG